MGWAKIRGFSVTSVTYSIYSRKICTFFILYRKSFLHLPSPSFTDYFSITPYRNAESVDAFLFPWNPYESNFPDTASVELMDDRRTRLFRGLSEIISFRKTTYFLTACVLRTMARGPELEVVCHTGLPVSRFRENS